MTTHPKLQEIRDWNEKYRQSAEFVEPKEAVLEAADKISLLLKVVERQRKFVEEAFCNYSEYGDHSPVCYKCLCKRDIERILDE